MSTEVKLYVVRFSKGFIDDVLFYPSHLVKEVVLSILQCLLLKSQLVVQSLDQVNLISESVFYLQRLLILDVYLILEN